MKKARPNLIVRVALGSFAVWVVFAGVVNPQWSRWNGIQQQLAARKKELRLVSLDASQRQAMQSSEVVRSLSSLWANPGAAEHSAYITRTMANLCKQSGLRLESVQPMSPRQDKTCQRHPATVTATGDLKSTTDLLIQINMLKGALDVERLSLRGSDKKGSVAVEMTVTSFSRLMRGESKRKKPHTSPNVHTGGL